MKKNIFCFALTILLTTTIHAQNNWNSFHGSNNFDIGEEIVMDAAGNVYITGKSTSYWGSPIRSFSGGASDGFVAKLSIADSISGVFFTG